MENPGHPLILKAFYVYALTIILSLLLIPLSSEFYKLIFYQSAIGYGVLWNRDYDIIIGSIIFSIAFLLPLFIFLIIPRKKWLIWLIGAIIPFIILVTETGKDILWFAILTILGGLIGWLIKLVYTKIKKQ